MGRRLDYVPARWIDALGAKIFTLRLVYGYSRGDLVLPAAAFWRGRVHNAHFVD